MEKLRESVIKLASANLNTPLSSSQIALIDHRLHESFPFGLRVPSHPTYATMVMNSITELSQEGGSSEDSISEYIKANHDDLPWAHKSILSHHLSRLCDEGRILLIASDRYSIPGFTPKPVFKRGKVKGKQVGVKQRRVICPENSEEHGVQPQGSLSGREELKLVFQENKEFVGLDSGDGIKDEHVTNDCRSLVVVGDKVEKKGQEEVQESEVFEKGEELEKHNSLITKLTIPETVKFRRRKNKIKHDQLLTGGTEKESLVDKCQDKTRNEILALEDYSSGDEWMNNGASVENLVKKKKKDVENPVVDRVIVCAIGTLPNPTESGRRVTRQSKKLTMSPVSKFPSSKIQKHDIRQEASILSGQETKSNWPSWVPLLLKTDFNGKCKIHANDEKSICNLYCSDCKNGALCTSCVTSHEGHHVIKIMQADFEQLVDVSDIEKYIDITDIRTIKESSTSIVLKRHATWKNVVKNNSTCLFCKNRVPFPNKFCTLNCKFQHEHKVG